MAIARTAKGTASDKTSALTLTVSNVQIEKDTSMIVGVGFDAGFGDPSMTWGTRIFDEPRERLQDLGIRTAYFSLYNNGATATHDVVLTWVTTGPPAKAMFVTQIDDVQHRDVFELNSGSDGSPTSDDGVANLPTNYAKEYFAGIFCSEGPVEDTAGTPGSSFISGQRAGTTGGVAATNITIHETYKIVTNTSANAVASKTGATARDWGAIITTLKYYPIVAFDTLGGLVELSTNEMRTVKDAMYTAMVAQDTNLNASLPTDAQTNLSADQKREAYIQSVLLFRIPLV